LVGVLRGGYRKKLNRSSFEPVELERCEIAHFEATTKAIPNMSL
jgi:hypothetical protein